MSNKYILGHRAQTRNKTLRYAVTFSAVLLLLAMLQVSLFGKFRLFGAVPDLMICAVLCIGFFVGQWAGAVSGIGAGFLIEALGGSGIVILPLCYLFQGYLIGYYVRPTQRGIVQYLICFVITLFYRASITVLYACMSYRNFSLPAVLLHTVLPEMGATALAGIILFFPMFLLCAWLEKQNKR